MLRRLGVVAVVVALFALPAASCGANRTEREIADINAAGEAQLEAHADDPLVQALDLSELTLVGEAILPAYVARNQHMIASGTILAASYDYNYEMGAADLDEILDRATSHFESLGATRSLNQPSHRILYANSSGDDIKIELILHESPTGRGGSLSHEVRLGLP